MRQTERPLREECPALTWEAFEAARAELERMEEGLEWAIVPELAVVRLWSSNPETLAKAMALMDRNPDGSLRRCR